MISETGYIRVIFTVTCGALQNDDCPSGTQLAPYRVLSEKPADPKQLAQWNADRKLLADKLREKDRTQSLIDIGHYRMDFVSRVTGQRVFGRDVFTGLARVPEQIFSRDERGTGLLELGPEAQGFFAEMFGSIFDDLRVSNPDNDGFCWLTWVVVPLIEAVEERFNALGMGGIGNC
jgi:hypothetical protein